MKTMKKYSGILLTVLLCVVLSFTVAMTASAALVDGPAPGDDIIIDEEDDLSEDPVDTPSEEDPTTSTDEEDPNTSENTESTESTESTGLEDEDASSDTEDTSSDEYTEENDSDDEDDDPEYYPGNGEDITGVIGTGNEEWGANYSEGTVVSGTGSTAKKNIADYHSKMMGLIWIPIVLIVLAAGTLVVVNVYFAKKNPKKGKKARRRGNDE